MHRAVVYNKKEMTTDEQFELATLGDLERTPIYDFENGFEVYKLTNLNIFNEFVQMEMYKAFGCLDSGLL